MAAKNPFTAAPGPCGWLQTALDTARKSAPASTTGPQFSGVIPPIATHGVCMVSCQIDRVSRSQEVGASLVVVGKKAPKAT